MIWIELRTNSNTYSSGWNFSESVWAPTRTTDGKNWPFWSLIDRVVKGDLIFHLREIDKQKRFVGFSIASTDGYITSELPTTKPHMWDFSKTFFKVELTNFQEVKPAVKLSDFFRNGNEELRTLFFSKKAKKSTQRLFYVIQRNKLQCLNGAYFSEFDGILAGLLEKSIAEVISQSSIVDSNVHTSESLALVKRRIGQQRFADNVKRNFDYKCCFPNCQVEGNAFLIAGHIARWADKKELSGNTVNGLCFCLMHDKAFENGFFTLNKNFEVAVLQKKIGAQQWLLDMLKQGEGKVIKQRQLDPSAKALEFHWERIGYSN